MPDRLILQDLAVECRLGIHEWERKTPQRIWIDMELAINAARAAGSDEIADALDYAALAGSVKRCAEARSYRLMETLAEALASHLLADFKTVEWSCGSRNGRWKESVTRRWRWNARGRGRDG